MTIGTTQTFDAQSNPRPASEQTKSQYIQAQADTVTTEYTNSLPVEPPDAPPDPPPPIQQMVLTFTATAASGGSRLLATQSKDSGVSSIRKPGKEKELRCAPCVKALCPRRHMCNGRGRREYCTCNHPPLMPGEKVRLSEKQIERRIALLRDEG